MWTSTLVKAQDSTGRQLTHENGADTIRPAHRIKRSGENIGKAYQKKIEFFLDTVTRKRRKFDSSLFINISIPSTSDYAEDLGKVYQMLSNIQGVMTSFIKLPRINDYLEKGDSALDVLKVGMLQSDRNFNVRNLQMFNTLLDALDRSTNVYTGYLNGYDTALDNVREQIFNLQNDTLMLKIFRDTTLTKTFQPQLEQLRTKWREVDSLVTDKGKEVNTLRSQASAHAITIGELLYMVDLKIKTIGLEAFGKEKRYLWESESADKTYLHDGAKEFNYSERQLEQLYFSNTPNHRLWLLCLWLLFFYWVWLNFRKLRRLDKMEAIERFRFTYINPYPIGSSVIFVLSLAPLFDLHAPAVYIESVQFVSMMILTVIFRKRLERGLFYGWCVFIFLFLLLFITRVFEFTLTTERWSNLIVDSLSVSFAIYFLLSYRKKFQRWIFYAICLYILFNLLAVVSNVFGRITFTHLFDYTAAYSLAQISTLGVFVKLVQESFLLQIQTSRTRKKYPEGFDYTAISRSVLRSLMVFAFFLWLIVFSTNLTLFDSLYDLLVDIFTITRHVGNFTFTLGGIALFLSIIGLANFLQKYIAYFFGDMGDDAAIDDKGQRSRLMVTRLILLIAGFLLAVAASGLPVDRITVILGALGVGIGLGLQGIVNNFVSGIILIFDRPLRVGDIVDIGDKRGRVKEIGIRTSTLLTEDGAEVIIPNGDVLSHNIINWTLSNNHVRQTLTFNIDRTDNTIDINIADIKEIVKKNQNVMEKKETEVLLNTINNKTTEVKIMFWCKDFNKSSLTSVEVRTAINQHLEKKGINVL